MLHIHINHIATTMDSNGAFTVKAPLVSASDSTTAELDLNCASGMGSALRKRNVGNHFRYFLGLYVPRPSLLESPERPLGLFL